VGAPSTINRAYSLLTVKAVEDGDQRIIEGTASDISTDRMGDVVVPSGAVFKLPLPLLWQHDKSSPIGSVVSATVTKTGIQIRAEIAKGVLPFIDNAWALIKAGLVRGLSIGFRPLEDGIEQIPGSFGLKFTSWEWLELSAVTIPAHQDATISTIKALDTNPADAGGVVASVEQAAPVAAPRVVKTTASRLPMKTYQEQIKDIEATIAAKTNEREGIHTKAVEAGRAKDQTEREQFDTLGEDLKALQAELADAKELEAANIAKAVPVQAKTSTEATVTRAPSNVVSVKHALPPGWGMARYLMCKINSMTSGVPAYELAKQVYPDYTELHQFMMKAAVPAGTTTQTVWAAPLVDQTTLASEFIEYLRPQTIIGRLNLRRVPFNVRIPRQTGGGTGYWVGEGAPKPLTSFSFDAVTLGYKKVAAIAVITQELARFSNPSAEMLVRDALRDALVERLDRDFIDPAEAGTALIQPASITNGLTALSSAGTSADNARTDLANLLATFVESNVNPSSLVLIMPNTLALALSVLVNSLGQPEFPGLSMNGGTLNGIPVVLSQYAANASGAGNMVIAVNTQDIFLADDGVVSIDASREASLQMLDNPTNNSATATPTTMVSMFQTNSIALLAERQIDWSKRRAEAVAYMDDVNWGSIGSPA
jgi:HK97 family phage major capsid protein/HK97 family phage prohead protease